MREGIRAALERAAAAAKGKEVRIGGGAATVHQFLCAGLIDELHFAISPILLGSGEALFGGINLVELRYRSREQKGTSNAMHVILSKEK